MGHIYYMMGKSASGKDSFYKKLIEEDKLKSIVIYTTRPIRSGEKDGVDYHFTDEAGYNKLLEAGKVIEERVYPSAHGPWIYFTVDDGSIDLSKGDYIGIGTPESYLRLKEYFGESVIRPLYIEVEDGERLDRALRRERSEAKPRYREMCRRFLADCDDFSEEKLEAAGIRRRFENRDFNECLSEIREYIADGYKGQ
ncbi:MAG: guanylate kinase [Lachnospiraceae bacterium]|nr:guanylate kinase [Lachnospiraceae bacterium]